MDYYYCVTPPDLSRNHYTWDDVPSFLRINGNQKVIAEADPDGGIYKKVRPSPEESRMPLRTRRKPVVLTDRGGNMWEYPSMQRANIERSFRPSKSQSKKMNSLGWFYSRKIKCVVMSKDVILSKEQLESIWCNHVTD